MFEGESFAAALLHGEGVVTVGVFEGFEIFGTKMGSAGLGHEASYTGAKLMLLLVFPRQVSKSSRISPTLQTVTNRSD